MKYACMLVVTISFTLIVPSIGAQTQHISVSAPFDEMSAALSSEVTPHISQPTAEINNGKDGAEAIMKALIKTLDSSNIAALGDPLAVVDQKYNSKLFEDKDFHCIFHILRWSPPDTSGKQTVQAQKWYLYHQGTLTLATPTDIPRLMGCRLSHFPFHSSKQRQPKRLRASI